MRARFPEAPVLVFTYSSFIETATDRTPPAAQLGFGRDGGLEQGRTRHGPCEWALKMAGAYAIHELDGKCASFPGSIFLAQDPIGSYRTMLIR